MSKNNYIAHFEIHLANCNIVFVQYPSVEEIVQEAKFTTLGVYPYIVKKLKFWNY